MTGKVPDDFKALATNAFLIDMAHLKGEDLTGVPVNLNLSLNDGGEKTIVRVEESLQGVFPSLFKKYFQKKLDEGVNKNLIDLKVASEK